MIKTYQTEYGKVSIYDNETYISIPFKNGSYWEIDTLINLKNYIDPNKNIIEIGGHCGTSSLVYASYLNDDKKVYVYEPQHHMFELLKINIKQNQLEDKIIPYNYAVFSADNMNIQMSNQDLDGGGGIVSERYIDGKNCNFGGISLGKYGEIVNTIALDSMKHENIGFIHCDAQGAEEHIFSGGKELIKKEKPVIFYENNKKYDRKFYDYVSDNYPIEEPFDIDNYCNNNLNYRYYYPNFITNINTLLLP